MELGKDYVAGAQLLEIELKLPNIVTSIIVENELKKDTWSFEQDL